MTPAINAALRGGSNNSTPTFLVSTPEGFEDREDGTLHTELVGQLLKADPLIKLFEDNRVIHTSDDCGNHLDCPECGDHRARHYIRLFLAIEEQRYQLDLPPNARRSFAEYAEAVGDEEKPMIRLTSTPKKSASGFTWAQVTVSSIEKETA